MIILLCFVRVFKRNINIKRLLSGLVVWQMLLHGVCVCALKIKLFGFCCGVVVFAFGFVSMMFIWQKKTGRNTYVRVYTHGAWGVLAYLHAISTYFCINYLLVHITVQRIGITYIVNAAERAYPYTKNSYFGGIVYFPEGYTPIV